MKILVTGSNGFIGKNLVVKLREQGFTEIVVLDKGSTIADLKNDLVDVDFVFHLAGVNRPKNEVEFKQGNTDLTQSLVDELASLGRQVPIVLTSSIQASSSNAYGNSKAGAETVVRSYQDATGSPGYIFRLPNVFGKWCKPNYNSAVATFCHNTVRDIPITINDASAIINLVYIDDVCDAFIALLSGGIPSGYTEISPVYKKTVGEIAELLKSFKDSRQTLITEEVGTGFTRALYSTYLSYLSPQNFAYTVPGYTDERGTFVEMLKTPSAGQISFFTAHPGITRGGHYHHTKNEKFLVIKGEARFRFKQIVSGENYELVTDSNKFQIVETVPGWTHDITNIGDDELVVMLWANEIFDRNDPDTIASEL